MKWSKTPVVNQVLAIPHTILLPSSFQRLSAFTPEHPEAISTTTGNDISGLNTEPAFLIHPASDSRYRVYLRTSLLTCRLGFGQVGLVPLAGTHLLASNNLFIPNGTRKVVDLTRHDWKHLGRAAD